MRWRFSSAVAHLAALAAIGLLPALVLVAVTGAPARAASSAQALPEVSGGLDVVPFPGTPDAPPGTRIDFPALAPAQLVSIRVVGSHSGPHTGTLSAQPGGRGTQFAPDRPFAAGERIWVSAGLYEGGRGCRGRAKSSELALLVPDRHARPRARRWVGPPRLGPFRNLQAHWFRA